MAERVYCAESSASLSMCGSAEVVDRWVLLEYRPVWRAKALIDNELQSSVRAWLEKLVADSPGVRSRPQFIRRPERDAAGVTLFIATAAGMRRFEVPTYDALLNLDLDRDGHIETRPQFFVCTNGQRDRCCARFGLPTYAALRALHGDDVWQTTHVGGHRFAPNVLVLPRGDLYGRVHAEDVSNFLAALDAGTGFDWLRGSSFEAPAVQAARGFTRGNERVESVVQDGADDWRVKFAGREAVRVELGPEEPVMASCDDAPKPVRSWRLRDG